MEARDFALMLRPGMRVFLHGMANESLAVREALKQRPDAARGVTFSGVFLPGMNDFDYGALHEEARSEGFFLSAAFRKGFEAGRFTHLPLSYRGIGDWLAATEPFDLALFQVAPPDAAGRCSFGVNADFGDLVSKRSHAVVAQVNPALPANPHDPGLNVAGVTAVIDAPERLREFPAEPGDAQMDAVAGHAAALVADGDTIQIGIGKVQAAIVRRLAARSDLGVHSGVLSDELLDLILGGQVNNRRKAIDAGRTVAMSAIGTQRLYDAMTEPQIALRPASYTHAPESLLRLPNLTCLNSALEVDLFGQVNAEAVNGRFVSGTGGLSDFAGTARRMPAAKSIIALPAETPSGRSRIVASLGGVPPSLTRADADIVVTEHGVARLRHLSLDGRADALTDIAGPRHRDALRDAWREIRKRL